MRFLTSNYSRSSIEIRAAPRSVDSGDPQKDDRWQYLAAACAALCLRNFLETEYIPPG